MNQSQSDRLLAYFKTGRSITSLNAFRLLGITRLAARIYDLEKQGEFIRRDRIVVKNRFNEDCHVTEYSCFPL